MANFGIIIPIRSDLAGMGLQVEDLSPNASQKNSVYDGEGQSGYVGEMADVAGATVFTGEAYTSGSRNTTAASMASFALAVADLQGGGNDSSVTQAPQMGLAAYIRERVQANAGGTLSDVNADAIAAALKARVLAGFSMTLADVNAEINGVTGGGEVLEDPTDLNVLSFGKVSDILRIIAGEAYLVPSNCALEDQAGTFLPLTHPDGAGEVAGGTTDTRRGRIENLSAVAAALDPVPVATGRFLEDGDAGYVGKRLQAMGQGFAASASAGKLRSLHDNAITVENPGFAYTAAAVTATTPRAQTIDGGNVNPDGSGIAVRVYDNDGNLLNLP